jgi:hypothetical protein
MIRRYIVNHFLRFNILWPFVSWIGEDSRVVLSRLIWIQGLCEWLVCYRKVCLLKLTLILYSLRKDAGILFLLNLKKLNFNVIYHFSFSFKYLKDCLFSWNIDEMAFIFNYSIKYWFFLLHYHYIFDKNDRYQ